MGIGAAKVEMSKLDTIFNNAEAFKIGYTAKTYAFTDMFFSVDNSYSNIINKETLQVLSFSKNTTQPGVTNILRTFFIDGEAQYLETGTIIPNNAFTIFTLLDYLAIYKPLRPKMLLLECEGLLYNANIIPYNQKNKLIKYQLDLNLQAHSNRNKLVEHSDIFTWAIFKEGAERYIWVNSEKNRVESCEFDVGYFTLKAEYLGTDE